VSSVAAASDSAGAESPESSSSLVQAAPMSASATNGTTERRIARCMVSPSAGAAFGAVLFTSWPGDGHR